MNNKRKYKKEQILIVAKKFFTRFGLKKTTMDEIAKATRMGKATLYHYFRSKEQVFAEVIQRESQILEEKLNEAIEAANNPKEKVRAYITTRINYINSLSNTYLALTGKYLDHYSLVKEFKKEFNEYEIRKLSSILNNGVEKNVFSTMNVKNVARMIGIALQGLELFQIVEEKLENFEGDVKLMTDILLQGICK